MACIVCVLILMKALSVYRFAPVVTSETVHTHWTSHLLHCINVKRLSLISPSIVLYHTHLEPLCTEVLHEKTRQTPTIPSIKTRFHFLSTAALWNYSTRRKVPISERVKCKLFVKHIKHQNKIALPWQKFDSVQKGKLTSLSIGRELKVNISSTIYWMKHCYLVCVFD